MRTLLRFLVIALVLAIPATVAAAITHHTLVGTHWTDPTPSRLPKPTPVPAPVTVTPAPTATVRPEPTGTPDPWPLGTCLTSHLQHTPCHPGVLRIVGTVRGPDPRPCAGLPETDHVRRTGDYALCLTTAQ
ncbi:hypothetical protein [Streptomyces sp. NBRC 110035]|uniref:hypothetical protein n=1 Tax=Streptomyces sp. NBRC 110035 TaxID=1547867 RepID=UPI0005A8924A|nr:hypothetical protein [Streptomyces sp. NBRC 110035]